MFPIVFDAQIRTGLLSFGVFWLRFIKNAEGFLKSFVLQKKKKKFVKETFCWNTKYKILGKTIRWGKWWICRHIKLLTFVSALGKNET